MEMVVEIDGDGSGGTSPSRQGAGTETFYPPNLPFGGGGATEIFVDFFWMPLGFLGRRLLIGAGIKVGGVQGAHTPCGRLQGVPVPRGVRPHCGPCPALLRG